MFEDILKPINWVLLLSNWCKENKNVFFRTENNYINWSIDTILESDQIEVVKLDRLARRGVRPIRRFQWNRGSHHELFFLPDPLLAEEDHGCFEHEAHGMQLQSLLNFAQELGDVEPLHTTVIQQLPGTQVNVLQTTNRELQDTQKHKTELGKSKTEIENLIMYSI